MLLADANEWSWGYPLFFRPPRKVAIYTEKIVRAGNCSANKRIGIQSTKWYLRTMEATNESTKSIRNTRRCETRMTLFGGIFLFSSQYCFFRTQASKQLLLLGAAIVRVYLDTNVPGTPIHLQLETCIVELGKLLKVFEFRFLNQSSHLLISNCAECGIVRWMELKGNCK